MHRRSCLEKSSRIGARNLFGMRFRKDYEPFDELSAFVGLASQIEDYQQLALSQPVPYLDYIESCVRDIQVAAQNYLRLSPRGFEDSPLSGLSK